MDLYFAIRYDLKEYFNYGVKYESQKSKPKSYFKLFVYALFFLQLL